MTEILSLSTVVQRDTVSIKSKKWPSGKIYEIASAADFGPFEYARLHQRQTEISRFQQMKRLTKKQKQRVEEILDELIGQIVLGLEPAVRRELTTQQKEQIVFAWVMHLNGVTGGKAPAAAGSRSTGTK